MATEIITSLLGLGGSIIGTFCGILVNNKLTNYRIEQLEKKVDKHNQLIERTYELENKYDVLEEKQKVTNHRLADLERSA